MKTIGSILFILMLSSTVLIKILVSEQENQLKFLNSQIGIINSEINKLNINICILYALQLYHYLPTCTRTYQNLLD